MDVLKLDETKYKMIKRALTDLSTKDEYINRQRSKEKLNTSLLTGLIKPIQPYLRLQFDRFAFINNNLTLDVDSSQRSLAIKLFNKNKEEIKQIIQYSENIKKLAIEFNQENQKKKLLAIEENAKLAIEAKKAIEEQKEIEAKKSN